MGFDFDAGTIRGLGTLVVAIAFIGLSLWVFNSRRNSEFAEACLLPFADEPLPPTPDAQEEPATRSNRP
ncbi:cbb3-type cytochrome c oxidase subunit 3 [Pseudomonas sp. D8002]|jgi:cytochrome c oxidase cbb3-type subunit 4|uniref:cbb3-type cytochrome oxidase subunit 3 n=1 Tax=Pseudomonas TaxID=286 RepID=UPI000272C752|nr:MULTISPECIES: cbb3-type cytochrome c oxidase subunit 3 [Pseudomonas]WEL44804.1 cbb3-type cytochrome c oxidase subunit 3 [Pseudomonas sp. CBSPBW29]WEL65897.1 cbb3-type cytochrome c oxidase subunit 3 [Pseudomonas sp. CBSPGW29]WEL69368.1 cbb3-type cytochrome c oxidase subunit 3 [Pseudomonas sp. CBSPCGW29]WEL76353.1 cbb3-type cytochrome c oxidase subunit 3 [Pseudomonas sp. CBSPAW29]WEL85060.1 cbb3-type cytochrome c oxidase subunit 3 [Pseudomonas sp. CBSPCAW29]WEL87864.1 cbb3-type cytochrome c 